MKTAYQRILLLVLAGILLITLEDCCYYDCCDCEYNVREWGLRPEYSTDLNDIVKLEDPRALRNPSKIYSYKHYILVNEPQQGMHIIDNSDPRNPEPIQFLKIAGSNDVAIKNDVIYADQFDNLIIIALDSLTDVMEKKLLPDVFENYGYYDVVPEEKDVYYECPDPSYGVVVNWVADSVDYPCYNY